MLCVMSLLIHALSVFVLSPVRSSFCLAPLYLYVCVWLSLINCGETVVKWVCE